MAARVHTPEISWVRFLCNITLALIYIFGRDIMMDGVLFERLLLYLATSLCMRPHYPSCVKGSLDTLGTCTPEVPPLLLRLVRDDEEEDKPCKLFHAW